jgi:hypothetical protein
LRRSHWFAAFVLLAALTALSAPPAMASLVNLIWTAPGDDGLIGRATRYDLRYSTTPITATNFALATQAKGLPTPAAAGTVQTFQVGGLLSGATYYFAIKTVDDAGNWSAISNVYVAQALVTGVDDPGPGQSGTLPGLELSLSNPWPNPASDVLHVAYTLPSAGPIQVDVYDVVGRHVRTIASGTQSAGRGELSWDLRDATGRSVRTGMYMMRARLGGKDWTRRLLVVR